MLIFIFLYPTMAFNFKIFSKLTSEWGRKQTALDSHLPIKVTRKSPQGPSRSWEKEDLPLQRRHFSLVLKDCYIQLAFPSPTCYVALAAPLRAVQPRLRIHGWGCSQCSATHSRLAAPCPSAGVGIQGTSTKMKGFLLLGPERVLSLTGRCISFSQVSRMEHST